MKDELKPEWLIRTDSNRETLAQVRHPPQEYKFNLGLYIYISVQDFQGTRRRCCHDPSYVSWTPKH